MAITDNSSNLTSTDAPILEAILHGDPLVRFLSRLRLHPVNFGLLVLSYGLIRTLVLPATFGYLRTVQVGDQMVTGLLDDWPVLVVELIMVPLVAGYYLWQPNTMQSVYNGMAKRLGTNQVAEANARESAQPLGWPGWVAVAITIGLLEAIHIQYVFQNYSILTWESVNGVMAFSRQLIRFLTFYMIVFIVIRQTFMIIGLNRLFSELSVNIAPLHPDKAGGLRILGNYVLTTGIIIGTIGLYVGAGFFRGRLNPDLLTIEFYASTVIYFVFAPLIFFLPIMRVHRQMKDAKNKLLADVSDQFDIEYQRLLERLKHDQMNSDDVSRMEAIQKVYQIADGAPEWPFDLEIVSKFTAAIILPVLVPLGISMLSKLFSP